MRETGPAEQEVAIPHNLHLRSYRFQLPPRKGGLVCISIFCRNLWKLHSLVVTPKNTSQNYEPPKNKRVQISKLRR